MINLIGQRCLHVQGVSLATLEIIEWTCSALLAALSARVASKHACDRNGGGCASKALFSFFPSHHREPRLSFQIHGGKCRSDTQLAIFSPAQA